MIRIAATLTETNPIKYDELGAEIWRVLDERDRLKSVLSIQKRRKKG